jgi:hypothetical protein
MRKALALVLVASAACGGEASSDGSGDGSGGGSASACEPALEILAPRPGTSVSSPFAVRYRTDCRGNDSRAAYLEMSIRDSEPKFSVEVPLDGVAGTVEVRADKLVSGLRDVTFTLLGDDHEPLANPAASVTVEDLTIEAGRSSA